MKGVYSPVKKVSEYREEKLEQLASAEERNRESFNPDVDLGPEPVTENQQRNQRKQPILSNLIMWIKKNPTKLKQMNLRSQNRCFLMI